MKKLLFMLLLTTAAISVFSQMPGGSYQRKGWELQGECEITMTSGEKRMFNGKIKNTEFEGDIAVDYLDVASITLVRTSIKPLLKVNSLDRYNGSRFKYVYIDGKHHLLQIYAEDTGCSIYCGRHYYQGNVTRRDHYMIRDGAEHAIKVDFGMYWKNIKKIFPGCPRLIQYQKDKQMRLYLSYKGIAYIYSHNCETPTDEEKRRDTEIMDQLLLDSEEL
jgi:hypothetical protein